MHAVSETISQSSKYKASRYGVDGTRKSISERVPDETASHFGSSNSDEHEEIVAKKSSL